MTKVNNCSICSLEYTRCGHNAQPVNNGRCCDKCNMTVVVPKRLENLLNPPVEEYEEEEEGPFECSECGNYVPRENDVCSQNCFNAMMR